MAGRRLALTPTEFELLAVIAARRGEIVDHWKLLRAGWADPRNVDPETLRTHLNHLNQKLVAEGHPGLRNVRGRGYGLRIAAGASPAQGAPEPQPGDNRPDPAPPRPTRVRAAGGRARSGLRPPSGCHWPPARRDA